MLLMKPNCETCGKELDFDSREAYICSYEDTFCENCVETIHHQICPNCSGNFEKRPIRKE